jgi:hypothetical protein
LRLEAARAELPGKPHHMLAVARHRRVPGMRSPADGTVPPQEWPLVRSGGSAPRKGRTPEAASLVVYPDDYPKASGRNGLVI